MMKKEAIQGNSKRPYTRKLIYEVCRVQTDFRRFLCDEFPYLKRQISSVLTYDDQISEFLDRETCDEILKKLRDHIENLKEEGELKEERYIELLDETERASQLSEPELNKYIFKDKISRKEKRNSLRWCLEAFGIIYVYKILGWLWSKINNIRVEGGTIVIAGVAGGGLYLSFSSGSCRYEPPHQRRISDFPMGSSAPSVLSVGQIRRTVNFCARGITVLQEDEPRHPLPPNAVDSKQVQPSQQLIYHLNMLLTMHAPMEVPQSSKAELAPYLGNSQLLNSGRYAGPFMQEWAITACESDQSNRLPINVALKWRKKTEASVRNCFPNQNCSEAKMFTISCEFSYSIADKKDEYRCPKQSFTILSDGVSFIKPPILPIQQELQPNTNSADIEFSSVLSQCGGAFSAIALLAACKNP